MKMEPMFDDVQTARDLRDRYAAARSRLMGTPPQDMPIPAPVSVTPPPLPPLPPLPPSRLSIFDQRLARILDSMPPGLSFTDKAMLVLEAVSHKGFDRKRQLLVATHKIFGIAMSDLCGYSRRPQHCHPRQFAMAIAVEVFGFSFPEAGRLFGRDHTTVFQARRKFGRLVRALLRQDGGQ